jgi:hypothetical protein
VERGEEMDGMPPNSTQNLNAKLSLTQSGQKRTGSSSPGIASRPSRGPAAQTKIVGGPRHYRGGYHLNV